MRGLIYKNFLCAKTQIRIFVFFTAALFLFSVMFAMSYRFGNLHDGFSEMVADGEIGAADVEKIAVTTILFLMLIPIALVSEMGILFESDRKASFFKVSASMPIRVEKRVLSYFLSEFLFVGMGLLVDVLLAFALNRITGLIPFAEFVGIILTFAGIAVIYQALVNGVVYRFPNGNIPVIQILECLFLVLLLVGFELDAIGAFLFADDGTLLRERVDALTDFAKHRFYIVLFAAGVIASVSYGLCVRTAKRKEGIW